VTSETNKKVKNETNRETRYTHELAVRGYPRPASLMDMLMMICVTVSKTSLV
jgi:hypothetical protein